MGDWARAKIRNSLAPYGPAVHVAVGALHGRPWNMQPPWEQGSLGGVLGSGSFFKPLVMPPEGATLVQSGRGISQNDSCKDLEGTLEGCSGALKAWADLEDDKRTSGFGSVETSNLDLGEWHQGG